MSTVVISSDEESVPSSPKAKRIKLSNGDLKEANKENNVRSSSSDSDDTESQETEEANTTTGLDFFTHIPKLQELLTVCLSKITDKEQKELFISKVDYLVKYYKNAGKEYTKSDEFKSVVNDSLERAKNGDLVIALQTFMDLTHQLKVAARKPKDENTERGPVRKLQKFLDKLMKKIAALEEKEVDFDQDDNSTYIQMQKYRERAVKVYSKLCKCRNENPQASSITSRKLDFSDSNYTEINQAINKKFKNGEIFPTYFDVEKCVRKCVKSKNLVMSEATLTSEARHCFEKLGNLLQYRRRYDLHDVHSQYLPSHQDPASQDSKLNAQLAANRTQANSAINSICEKYVRLQEEGKDAPNVSSDSEDSNYPESDDEDTE